MDKVSESRPHVCELCSRGFKRRQVLKRHMGSHSNLRPYGCEFCGKTYKYKKGVNRHIKLKHVEKWRFIQKAGLSNFSNNPYQFDVDIYLFFPKMIILSIDFIAH